MTPESAEANIISANPEGSPVEETTNPEIARLVDKLSQRAMEAGEAYFGLTKGAIQRTIDEVTRVQTACQVEDLEPLPKGATYEQRLARKKIMVGAKDKAQEAVRQLVKEEAELSPGSPPVYGDVRPLAYTSVVAKYSNEQQSAPEDIVNSQGETIMRLHQGDNRKEKITITPDYVEIRTKEQAAFIFKNAIAMQVAVKPGSLEIPVTFFSMAADNEIYPYRLHKRVLVGDSEEGIPEGLAILMSQYLGCEGCYDDNNQLKYVLIHYRNGDNHCFETYDISGGRAGLVESTKRAEDETLLPELKVAESEVTIKRVTPSGEIAARTLPRKADFEGWAKQVFNSINVVEG